MDNKDNLSDFIKNNKEAFDLQEPSQKVWSALENDLGTNKSLIKRFYSRQLLKAAVMIFAIGCIAIYVLNLKSQVNQMSSTIDIMQMQELQKDQKEAFNFYQTSYDNKKERLMQLSQNQYQQAEPDLEELEDAFIELKKELGSNYNNEQVIQKLIEHYQLKIKILDRMLDIIEEYPEGTKSL